MQVSSLRASVIEEPPSCVAFCPSHPASVVIGTYLLHKDGHVEGSAQRRTGKLMLYNLQGSILQQQQIVELDSAVLDIEWSPHRGHEDILAVATSTGSLLFYRLIDGELHHIAASQIAETTTIVLDLVWHPTAANIIAATLSTGEVVLCTIPDRFDSESTVSKQDLVEVTTHTLEPWTLAISSDGERIFSGGDDTGLQCCAIAPSEPAVLWQDRKLHQAGVTAIMPLEKDLVVTGSYDDHIRLILTPDAGRRQLLAELDLEGGVWRLKLLDQSMHAPLPRMTVETAGMLSGYSTRYTMLASCMHAGARVVQLSRQTSADADEWHFEVLARFEEHKSMNYGSDVQPAPMQTTKTIVSTSFYDRRVCVWQYSPVSS